MADPRRAPHRGIVEAGTNIIIRSYVLARHLLKDPDQEIADAARIALRNTGKLYVTGAVLDAALNGAPRTYNELELLVSTTDSTKFLSELQAEAPNWKTQSYERVWGDESTPHGLVGVISYATIRAESAEGNIANIVVLQPEQLRSALHATALRQYSEGIVGFKNAPK